MWFSKNETGTKRRLRRTKNRRLGPIRSVRTRVKSAKGVGPSRPAAFLLVSAMAVTAGFLLWLGIRVTGGLLFSRNPVFTISRLIVRSDSPVTGDYIRGKQGIREGANLFAFNIRAVRADFLRGAPNFKSMDITRILPDTLNIEVSERVPLARIGRRDGFVVDHEGFVFGPKVKKPNLPVIVGYKGPLLRPGNRIEGVAADAVKIFSLCDSSSIGADVALTGIDISGGFTGKDDDMQLYLAGKTLVDFWWPRRGPKGYSADRELEDRLLFLRGVIRRAAKEGRRLRSVNLALESYEQNCPVVFWEE